jgi:serine protease Do
VPALTRFFLVLTFLATLVLPPAQAAETGLEHAVGATLILRSDDGEERLLGSGFRFLGPDLAVTNAHVVGRAATVLVFSPDGTRRRAEVIGVDELRDIALLRLPDAGEVLRGALQPRLGQVVYAIGAPFGAEFSLSRGVVSSLARQIEANVPVRMIQHDAAVNPGSSGGPLVDEAGRIIGMNSQIADGFRNFVGIAYAIPVTRIVEVAGALLDGRALPEVHLGLRVRPLTPKIRNALAFDGSGVLVDHVAGGGAADRAGLKPGDVLVKVAGERISTPGDIAFALDGVRSGRIVLSVIRKGALSEMIAETSPDPMLAPAQTSGTPEIRSVYSLEDFGLIFDPASRIESVRDKSFAQYLGLSVGDRVLALDGTAVSADMLGGYQITRPALLLIELSDRSTRHYVLDPWAAPGRLLPVSGANVLDAETVIF